MSKISEQKALVAYPMVNPPYSNSDKPKLNVENLYKRKGYIDGYDQAIQDFLEKACKWWSTMPDDTYGFNPCKIYVEQFKNYIQDEIQD